MMPIALPPVSVISLATLSTAALSRWPLTTTFAPARANNLAIARPILRPDPVMSAVRPASGLPSNIMEDLSNFQHHGGAVGRRKLDYCCKKARVDVAIRSAH